MIFTMHSKWQPTPVFLLGEVHGQRSLAGYSPRVLKESDTTERLTHTHTHTHTPLSEILIGGISNNFIS